MNTIKIPGGEISFVGKATEEGTLEIYPFGIDKKEIKICIPNRSLVADECAKIMVKAFNKYVLHCHVTASPVLMNRWSKKAEIIQNKLEKELDKCGAKSIMFKE